MDITDIKKATEHKEQQDMDDYDVFGEVMSVEEFRQCVDVGMFVDDDGFGYACDVDGNEYTNIKVMPSQADAIPDHVDYVVWYNK